MSLAGRATLFDNLIGSVVCDDQVTLPTRPAEILNGKLKIWYSICLLTGDVVSLFFVTIRPDIIRGLGLNRESIRLEGVTSPLRI